MLQGKTAWVVGATGLIGGQLVEQLCAHEAYEQVIALVRRPPRHPRYQHPKVSCIQVDFDALTLPEHLPVHHVYCALGTTKRKTPDPETYHRIDVEYPLAVARLGLDHGATHYAVVSAHGAHQRSLSAYLRLKGELENRLAETGYAHLVIARPGLLLGNREEFRPAEKVAELVTRCLPGNYRAIKAKDVAAAMIQKMIGASLPVKHLSSASMQNRAQVST